MVKFVILFHKPDDLDRFETGYNALLGLIENISQIKRRQVGRGPDHVGHHHHQLDA